MALDRQINIAGFAVSAASLAAALLTPYRAVAAFGLVVAAGTIVAGRAVVRVLGKSPFEVLDDNCTFEHAADVTIVRHLYDFRVNFPHQRVLQLDIRANGETLGEFRWNDEALSASAIARNGDSYVVTIDVPYPRKRGERFSGVLRYLVTRTRENPQSHVATYSTALPTRRALIDVKLTANPHPSATARVLKRQGVLYHTIEERLTMIEPCHFRTCLRQPEIGADYVLHML